MHHQGSLMEYSLPLEESSYLRSLAERQSTLAALPVMRQREAIWTATNDAVAGTRPPFVIESWTFDRDFMPSSLLQCKTDLGRRLETQFLRHIRHHEILNDDHVCPHSLDMHWHVHLDEFGIDIKNTYANDAEGVATGYHVACPIKDLNDGFDMIRPSSFSVNRESTLREKAFLEETFGDILPVHIQSDTFGRNNLTQRLLRLMSMETFFMAMFDCPDKLDALLSMLCDNAIRMARWAESEGLLRLNNRHQCAGGSCYNFTTSLPARTIENDHVRLSDMWGAMDSQETVGISPDMFHDLIFPYYRKIAELLGRVYWGCCEPADPIWDRSLSQLTNLKAVSISRWANQDKMADVLQGTGIVFSRKPDPNILGVSPKLDENAWRSEIRSTLETVLPRGVPLQLVVRDVYSAHGNLNKMRRAVDIAREEIDYVFGSLPAI